MKELSIEEKAKRYDEALARANEMIKDMTNMGGVAKVDDIQYIFPELKESEDERIRKGLIEYFLHYPDHEITYYDLKADFVIAWLEKQGEQKPKFRVGDTIKCKYDDRQFTIKSVDLDKGTYTYTQEGCGNDIDYADEEFELVEQNPAWSEEDEKKLLCVCAWIKDYPRIADFKDEMYTVANNYINWLKSLRPKWKPNEEILEALYRAIPKNVMEISEDEMLLDKLYQGLKYGRVLSEK